MSGYLEAQLIILCLSTIYAYGIFIPAASGQLNLGAAGFITLGAYASAWFNSMDGLGLSATASVILAMVFTGIVSFLISFPILRTKYSEIDIWKPRNNEKIFKTSRIYGNEDLDMRICDMHVYLLAGLLCPVKSTVGNQTITS